jgi:hypothetical protein
MSGSGTERFTERAWFKPFLYDANHSSRNVVLKALEDIRKETKYEGNHSCNKIYAVVTFMIT